MFLLNDEFWVTFHLSFKKVFIFTTHLSKCVCENHTYGSSWYSFQTMIRRAMLEGGRQIPTLFGWGHLDKLDVKYIIKNTTCPKLCICLNETASSYCLCNGVVYNSHKILKYWMVDKSKSRWIWKKYETRILKCYVRWD